MPLTPGTRLGPYEILSPLGAGGMGEVYRARDTRLDRSVAIKVLPQHLASTTEFRARFDREARTISALNHAHICTLYDVGHLEGIDFLVLEHLDGETLANRLDRGPLPIDQVLRYGIQIADALDCAHRSGIVHRDLKPGNIMLTGAGTKLLDFGLARSTGPTRTTGTTSMPPTMNQPLTAEGTIIGTFQYMAPEQLEGAEADTRTDLWAFGAVLYEMATGRRAFQGKSQASLIAAIMSAEPAPLTALAPLAPADLERIVRRCLEKNPEDRWQTARDLVHELRWIQEGSSGGRAAISPASLSVSPGQPATQPAGAVTAGPDVRSKTLMRKRAARLAALAGVALLLALAGIGFFRFMRKGPPRLNPNMTLRTVQVPLSAIAYPGLSGDGKWIALPAGDENDKWDLYFMNANGGEVRKITQDDDFNATYADISPDGSQVVYSGNRTSDRRAQVRVVSSLGGASRVLADDGVGPHWSPDGQQIGYVVTAPVTRSGHLEFWVVRADGSNNRLVFADTAGVGGGRFSLAWSPDGGEIAWLRTLRGTSRQELFVRNLATGRERQLTKDGSNIDELAWTRQNEIVFTSNRSGNTNLWIIRASGGEPVQITKGIGPDIGVRVSSDGRTLLYLQQQPVGHIWLGDIEKGTAREITHDDIIVGSLALSPDHSTIAAAIRVPDPIRSESHIWLINREGGERRQITRGDEFIRSVAWSPNGDRLAYIVSSSARRSDSTTVCIMDPSAPGGSRPVFAGLRLTSAFWTDEHTLLVIDQTRSRLVPASGGSPSGESADSTFTLPSAIPHWTFTVDVRSSHKGSWLTSTNASGKVESEKRLFGPEFSVLGVSPGAHYLLVWRDTGRVMKVMLPAGTLEPVPGFFPGLTPFTSAGASRDAKEIVYREPTTASKLVLIENLLP